MSELSLVPIRQSDEANADSNPYMVGINEAMGFRPHSRSGEWQLHLQLRFDPRSAVPAGGIRMAESAGANVASVVVV